MFFRHSRIVFPLILAGAINLSACRHPTASVSSGQSDSKIQETAKSADILASVRKHIALPDDIKPTVAEILDVATLQARNSFYKNAVNGDYLIVTTTRAILYSPSKDMILDVMPVQLERTKPVDAPQMQP
jgi:hypothetical protein